MKLKNTQTSTTAKLPMLKQGDYEMWRLRIEQYFQVQDYALWDVIENGNSFKPVAQTTTNDVGTSTTLILGPVTTEEKAQKKNDVKARSMLLMELPNEHLMTFNQYKDAKTLFATIETIFDLNLKFLRSLPSEWNTHVVVWRNKSDLDIMSIDDLYNNFKIVEQEVKRTASSNSSSQNMAFVSSPSPSNTNEVPAAYGVSTASTQSSTASTKVSTAKLSNATMYAFLSNQSNRSQLVHEDLKQIHEDDLEEMDLKWQLALLSMRAHRFFQKTGKKITINGSDIAGFDKSKVECYNFHKIGNFSKECRQPINQDSSKRTMNVEETPPKAMVAIDGVGFDWSCMAEDEVRTNMALINFTDFERSFNSLSLKSLIGIDVGIGMEVNVRIDVEDKVEEGLQDIYDHVIEIPLQRIKDIETAQRELTAGQLIASGERELNMTITLSGMTPEAIEELVNRCVEEALAAYEEAHDANALNAENQSQNGSDGDNGNGGNGNGENANGENRNGENGNGRNGNPNENDRGDRPVARECTYQDFMKCQPLNFKGTERAVGLTVWFEKMKTVFHINNYPEKYQVKMVLEEEDRIESLMDQKLKGYAVKNAENKEGWRSIRETTVGSSHNSKGQMLEGRIWQEPIRLATMRDNCIMDRCLSATSRGQIVNQRVVTCFECGRQGYYMSDCPKLKDQNRGNKAGNKNGVGEARGKAYVLGGGDANPNSNVVKDTFLLNNYYAFVLFDSGTDRSFDSGAVNGYSDFTAVGGLRQWNICLGGLITANCSYIRPHFCVALLRVAISGTVFEWLLLYMLKSITSGDKIDICPGSWLQPSPVIGGDSMATWFGLWLQPCSTKKDANGNIVKHKARLVAKGYIQKHGIDFEEVFAPVARMETIRLLLAIADNNKWEVHHLDIKSAFLHRDLKEEVYVIQPEGFIKKQDQKKVYRLIKALYGLRQAPRAWNIKPDNTLKSLDFKKCALEQAIYTKRSKDLILLIGVYVDDLIIIGTPKEEIDNFKAQMEEKIEMSNLGLLAYYLGIEVTQNNGDISIKQSTYASKILKEAGMIDYNETLIPMDPGTRLTKITEGTMVNSTEYRSLIGCLRYLLHTRPDLSYSVGLLSRFMQEPREQHMKAIRQVLRYVQGTKDHGITYKHNGGNKIHGYSDSSYGVNTQEEKGTTGVIFYYGESPISWSTQKQTTVALSSCESEFIAATTATTQALWLKRLLSKPTQSQEEKVIIQVDNKSAIALMKNLVFHGRSKHIDTKYHFIRECVEREDIQVKFVSGEYQNADILTKALPKIKFLTMRQLIGLKNLRSNVCD
nr:ribonuclease H-like domain, reverse transcriptase, RNA-dependent DNA polymerase [Tanacetum cinerariifolium]